MISNGGTRWLPLLALLVVWTALGLKVDPEADDADVQDVRGQSDGTADTSSEAMLEYLVPPVGARLNYRHFGKSGGNTLRKILHAFLNPKRGPRTTLFELGGERDRMNNDTDTFTVGSVRNPCNWYVSAWAYGWSHLLATSGTLPPLTPNRDTPYDVINFRDAVNRSVANRMRVSGRNPPGVMSSVMAYVYLRTDVYPNANFQPNYKQEMDAALVAIENFDPSSIDCWIKTEALPTDVGVCLMKYEEATGAVINWEAYEKWVTEVTAKSENKSPHMACEEYYDEETERLVREAEAPIFEKFGYENCCGD